MAFPGPSLAGLALSLDGTPTEARPTLVFSTRDALAYHASLSGPFGGPVFTSSVPVPAPAPATANANVHSAHGSASVIFTGVICQAGRLILNNIVTFVGTVKKAAKKAATTCFGPLTA